MRAIAASFVALGGRGRRALPAPGKASGIVGKLFADGVVTQDDVRKLLEKHGLHPSDEQCALLGDSIDGMMRDKNSPSQSERKVQKIIAEEEQRQPVAFVVLCDAAPESYGSDAVLSAGFPLTRRDPLEKDGTGATPFFDPGVFSEANRKVVTEWNRGTVLLLGGESGSGKTVFAVYAAGRPADAGGLQSRVRYRCAGGPWAIEKE